MRKLKSRHHPVFALDEFILAVAMAVTNSTVLNYHWHFIIRRKGERGREREGWRVRRGDKLKNWDCLEVSREWLLFSLLPRVKYPKWERKKEREVEREKERDGEREREREREREKETEEELRDRNHFKILLGVLLVLLAVIIMYSY